MRDLFGIRHFFQRVAQERADSRALQVTFEETAEAIDAGDVAKVRETSASTQFNYRQAAALIVKAINTDNVAMFNAVLDGRSFEGDQNQMLHFRDPMIPEGPNFYSESSMLYEAISLKKTNIAAALASDPETDITQSGSSTVSRYRNGRSERDVTEYSCPLDAARSNGMTEVIIPLARRTAEALQKKASGLLLEAQGLSPA